jgi:hypothetical protein
MSKRIPEGMIACTLCGALWWVEEVTIDGYCERCCDRIARAKYERECAIVEAEIAAAERQAGRS